LLVTGLWLAASERIGKHQRSMTQLNVVDSLLIGLAQAVAIAPGISRSGATIATGLLRGLQREAAARYAFLLSIPIIFGAGAAQLRGLAEAGSLAAQAPDLVIGFIAAAVSGYLCIRFLLRYLQRGRLYAFAIYCWVVGLGVIAIALFRGMP
jgi:undecaprenyl-diphosphatase